MLFFSQQTQRAQVRGMAGRQGQGLGEMLLRLFQASERHQRITEIMVSIAAAWLQLDGLLEKKQRVLALIEPRQSQPHVRQGRDKARLMLQRRLEEGRGLADQFPFQKQKAE